MNSKRITVTAELEVPICDLYPYEASVVKNRVERLLEVLRIEGDFSDPISVNKIYGHFIVRHGNHRVYAARQFGKTTIKAKLVKVNSKDVFGLARDISYRDSQCIRGYDNYFIVETDDDRDKRTLSELVLLNHHNPQTFIDLHKDKESILFD